MATPDILRRAMAIRAAKGLRLDFETPDGPFTCYPKNDAQRMAWLESAAKQGWQVTKLD